MIAELGEAGHFEAWEEDRLDKAIETVVIDDLVLGESPRMIAHDSDHVQVIAAVEGALPPIVVHRPTMTVIDGVHRVLAYQLRGQKRIAVRFFDGSAEDAFLLAVKSNVLHGLPLSLSERETAAVRVVRSHASWSDRAIAHVVGLSATTVAAIRRRSTEESGQSNVRIGLDGRVRPLDAAAGRIRAGQVIAARPDASIREIAREAGISVGTAHDVRRRLLQGLDPVPPNQRMEAKAARPARRQVRGRVTDSCSEVLDCYQQLRRDPSLRYTEEGRSLIRRLGMCMLDEEGWQSLVDAVPPHQAMDVANLARSLAALWQKAADEISSRAAIAV